MEEPSKEQIEESVRVLKTRSAKTIRNIIAALLIWLFGNFVFIPLAASLNFQMKLMTSLIFFSFSVFLIISALPDLKKSIDAFSVLPSKKLTRKGFTIENSRAILRYSMYAVTGVICYMLFSPFLVIFHPSVNGIALIFVLIWISVLLLKTALILLPKFIEWLLK